MKPPIFNTRHLLNLVVTDPYQIFVGSRWHWYICTLPIHAKIRRKTISDINDILSPDIY